MDHVMLDLETFGTKAGCVLRSIGAVFFDPTHGVYGEEFYTNYTYEDQVAAGAHIDPDTEIWWSKQSKAAQDALTVDQKPFEQTTMEFIKFFKQFKGKYVWSQGSNFDCVLIEHSMELFGIKVPWRFFNTRDTRTVYQMSGFATKSIFRRGEYHNALDDAKHQARCVIESYRRISNGKV